MWLERRARDFVSFFWQKNACVHLFEYLQPDFLSDKELLDRMVGVMSEAKELEKGKDALNQKQAETGRCALLTYLCSHVGVKAHLEQLTRSAEVALEESITEEVLREVLVQVVDLKVGVFKDGHLVLPICVHVASGHPFTGTDCRQFQMKLSDKDAVSCLFTPDQLKEATLSMLYRNSGTFADHYKAIPPEKAKDLDPEDAENLQPLIGVALLRREGHKRTCFCLSL